mmetsp:Transcript_26684/g.63320  ORF Transcript_26684/g.63320 Transcript_26684/m.63320 type:complete len:271 (+) Transcript_26684:397-1209(+)
MSFERTSSRMTELSESDAAIVFPSGCIASAVTPWKLASVPTPSPYPIHPFRCPAITVTFPLARASTDTAPNSPMTSSVSLFTRINPLGSANWVPENPDEVESPPSLSPSISSWSSRLLRRYGMTPSAAAGNTHSGVLDSHSSSDPSTNESFLTVFGLPSSPKEFCVVHAVFQSVDTTMSWSSANLAALPIPSAMLSSLPRVNPLSPAPATVPTAHFFSTSPDIVNSAPSAPRRATLAASVRRSTFALVAKGLVWPIARVGNIGITNLVLG